MLTRCQYKKKFPTHKLVKIDFRYKASRDVPIVCYDYYRSSGYTHKIFFTDETLNGLEVGSTSKSGLSELKKTLNKMLKD